jgi:phospholipid/cholesterol/gamma-HCH transport system substrate-binding protein
MKNFFTREIKIGLMFLVTVAILFFGLNFLKGINIFTTSNRYFVVFENIDGLVVSNSVTIKGYKVGQVRRIDYDFTKQRPFLVEISVEDNVRLPKGTVVYLADEGLMGGKILDIQFAQNATMHISGDTIATDVEKGLFSTFGEYLPKIDLIISNLDTTMVLVKELVNSPSLHKGLNSFSTTMDNLNVTMAQLKLATANLPATMSKLDDLATNIKSKVNDLEVAKLTTSIDKTLQNIEMFSQRLNSQNSSLGLLMNDRAVYDNLNSTIKNADALMIDLKANPKRYVNFSVFGKKEK